MKLRTDKRVNKTILTTEGYLTFNRNILRPGDRQSLARLLELEGVKSVAPMDSYLGIDHLPFKITVSMMLKIAEFAIEFRSYQDVEEFFLKNWNIRISDDQIREVVDYIGHIVFQEDCRLADEAMQNHSSVSTIDSDRKPMGTLYIEMDGAMFNTRDGNDGKAGWKENKLGMVFNSQDIYSYKDQNGTPQHRILKREYICYAGAAEEFKKHLFALALRNGCDQAGDIVIISDGAAWIRSLKEELFPSATQILDLFHLKENVTRFAIFLHRNIKLLYRPWSKKVCAMLEDGKWEEVLAMPELQTFREKETPAGVVNLYRYIENNKQNIDYPSYKAQGFFVGSGAIESGNRTVLQERLKLPGMRWNIDRARGVLSLKAKHESGLWQSTVAPLVQHHIQSNGSAPII